MSPGPRRPERHRSGHRRGLVGALMGSLVGGVAFIVLANGTAGAVTPALIQGSGSSWAANAVNQWVADVASQGVQVVYTPDGDAQGRQDYANRTSDFSVTSDGYQGVDPVTGINDTSQGRPYAYLPIAAGGTSFPYQIRFDGQQVENLRLSGQTLAKIFTNQITNWDDPAITADNNGHALPSLPITPVVQSEGSSSTNQLTTYFATDFPSIWKAYSGLATGTEYFPRQGEQVAVNGSNSAMNYVDSQQANGSITYVEYSFALSVNYPVAKVLNANGYYTLPTQYNVAVALEAAQINMDPNSPDYLLQNLTDVYVDPDPRTYPLSSYVYMIEPTGTYPNPEPKVTTSKRQALADFEYYDICQGQKEIGPIGYSPLPVNLVEAGFGQIQKLQTADPGISLANMTIDTCDNPTFIQGQPNENYLAQIAPLPPTCDHVGQGPCAAGVTPTGPADPVNPDTPRGPTGASQATTTGPGGGSAAGTPGSAAAGGTTGTGPAGAAGAAGAAPCAASTTTSTTSTLTTTAGPRTAGGAAPTAAGTGVAGAGTPASAPCPAGAGPSGPSSSGPSFVSATLVESGGPSVSVVLATLGLLALFSVPAVVGWRRSRSRRAAAAGPAVDLSGDPPAGSGEGP